LRFENSLGDTVEAIESAITRCDDFTPLWHTLQKPWVESRVQMFLTQGASNDTPWAPRSYSERRYYMPRKRAALKQKPLAARGLNRFTRTPSSRVAGEKERLFPGMTDPSHRDFVWDPQHASLTMGVRTPWATALDVGGTSVFDSRRHGREVSVVHPARPLIRFGPVFVEDVRGGIAALAVSANAGPVGPRGGRGPVRAGGRVGLSTDEVMGRLMSGLR
jgi:hypothetical protein